MIYTDNLLTTVFSANVGESDAEQRSAVARIASNPDTRQREGLREELRVALADAGFDWDALLDHHEVYPGDGQLARRFVIDRIWTPLFGPETIPA